MNSTPFVRQYGILLTNGVLLYAKRNTEQEIHWWIQARSCRDDDESKAELPWGSSAVQCKQSSSCGVMGAHLSGRGPRRSVHRATRPEQQRTLAEETKARGGRRSSGGSTVTESRKRLPKKIECLGCREGTAREKVKVIWELRHKHKLSLLLDVAGLPRSTYYYY